MKKLIPLVTFIVGAAIGSVTTWYYTKKKYEQFAQEQIDSVKEIFSYKKEEEEEPEEDSPEIPIVDFRKEKPDVTAYAKMLKDKGYTDYTVVNDSDDEEDEEEPPTSEEGEKRTWRDPYVVSPDEFGEFDDYGKISLTFYSDHILTDENNEPIEDIERTVGFESLNHFGEYEDDSVFVRNERLKVDFEILLDQRKYSDVLKENPYLRGF